MHLCAWLRILPYFAEIPQEQIIPSRAQTTAFNVQYIVEYFRKKFNFLRSIGRLIKLKDSTFLRIYY